MSKRYNHYHIKVDFSISNKECAIGNVYAKYLNGKDNEDSFHFFSKSFTLIASRSKSYEDGTILSNNGNSINKQLLRGSHLISSNRVNRQTSPYYSDQTHRFLYHRL